MRVPVSCGNYCPLFLRSQLRAAGTPSPTTCQYLDASALRRTLLLRSRQRDRVRLYGAVARRALHADVANLCAAYEDLHTGVAASSLWTAATNQLRLVLSRYAIVTTEAERSAIASLEGQLARYCSESNSPCRCAPTSSYGMVGAMVQELWRCRQRWREVTSRRGWWRNPRATSKAVYSGASARNNLIRANCTFLTLRRMVR